MTRISTFTVAKNEKDMDIYGWQKFSIFAVAKSERDMDIYRWQEFSIFTVAKRGKDMDIFTWHKCIVTVAKMEQNSIFTDYTKLACLQ
jgi:hypothetical protein